MANKTIFFAGIDSETFASASGDVEVVMAAKDAVEDKEGAFVSIPALCVHGDFVVPGSKSFSDIRFSNAVVYAYGETRQAALEAVRKYVHKIIHARRAEIMGYERAMNELDGVHWPD